MATIEEDYVSFEIAKLLKEKGFNEPTIGTYNIESKNPILIERPIRAIHCEAIISAPTLQMAMKWLREVHHIFLSIQQHMDMSYVWYAYVDGVAKGCDRESHNNTYEEACEAAIKYCLSYLMK